MTISTLDYEQRQAVEYEPFMTIIEVSESAPPPVPEFDLGRFVERRACTPLAELLEDMKPLDFPAAIFSAGVEFILSILDCRRI